MSDVHRGRMARRRREEEVRSPFDGEVVGVVPVAERRGCRAGGHGRRRRRARDARALGLRALGDPPPRRRRHGERVDELARTIALEAGKPLVEARGEAARIPPLLRTSAAEGARMHGETVPVDAAANGAGKLAFTIRQPCGVVVAISPFNYPAMLVAHKIGPALAAGNAVVLKPARQTPLTALLLTRRLLEAGLPENAIQCLTGSGAELGRCSAPTRACARSASRARPRSGSRSPASPASSGCRSSSGRTARSSSSPMPISSGSPPRPRRAGTSTPARSASPSSACSSAREVVRRLRRAADTARRGPPHRPSARRATGSAR